MMCGCVCVLCCVAMFRMEAALEAYSGAGRIALSWRQEGPAQILGCH